MFAKDRLAEFSKMRDEYQLGQLEFNKNLKQEGMEISKRMN